MIFFSLAVVVVFAIKAWRDLDKPREQVVRHVRHRRPKAA